MTTTTTQPAPAATYGHTTRITPDGFAQWGAVSYYARNADAPRWTIGLMQIVAAVIGDWPCMIETDAATRGMHVGRIVAVQHDYRVMGSWAVVIETTFGDGTTQRTAYPGMKIGAIIPMPAPATGRGPSYYDVTRRMFAGCGDAAAAWRRHVAQMNGGLQWYGKITVHAAEDGGWYVYYDSQENARHDVTTARTLSDGTRRQEYTYGPLHATFTVSADGAVTETTRREHHDADILAWRNA